jgi:DNA-binding GntR family transcriptional regulator
MEVDRSGSVPPYQQITGEIIARIRSGELRPGDRLPSLTDISQRWGVAKVTAVKVLRVLREDGYAVTRHGWGTFVAGRESWPAGD